MLQATMGIGRRSKGRVLVCAMREGARKTSWKGVPAALAKRLHRTSEGLVGGDHVTLYTAKGTGFEHCLRIEHADDPEVDPGEWYRRAGARLYRALALHGVKTAHLLRPGGEDFDLEAFAEGFLLASYRYAEYLSDAPDGPTLKLTVEPEDKAADAAALRAAEDVVASVTLTRDLVNRPAADLYPETFAAACKQVAEAHGMRFKVFSGKTLEKEFPALHAVGKGSDRPPRMIRLDYGPTGKAGEGLPHYVLCGKGVTYDSGGYHLKGLESMFLMKKDMGGAAAALGALDLAARMQLPLRVTLLIAAAENMVSGDAFRPGDVIRSRAGKTIEIRSTDAEGRLVLSDALAYGAELEPDGMIDLATLTGIAKRFLADVMSPVTGTDEVMVADLVQAGKETHERLYSIPLLREYREATRGRISDVKNWGSVGGGSAGTMVAAGFLRHFVGDTPWAHIDMSNTSWCDGEVDYLAYGATGFGVRAVAQYLADRCAPEADDA